MNHSMVYFLGIMSEGGYGMSRVCAVSGKKALSGNKRSHSLRATRHKQKLNLQTVRLEDGSKVRMTTKEIKTQRKNVKAA